MAKKKNKYIKFELDWLETKATQLKEYVDARPFTELKDRFEWKTMSNGGSLPIIVATVEAQRKDLALALKDYAEIIDVINDLREKNEVSNLRNDDDMPDIMDMPPEDEEEEDEDE
jgi:uncharacterized protein YkwD